ncbi:MAG: hypothetical protein JWM28_1095, partial [Chitinophagaceae bacterium]|nr:hypothetical protein [Chitinophagaceae bacterium]
MKYFVVLKILLVILLVPNIQGSVSAQTTEKQTGKPALNFSNFNRWSQLSNTTLSNDGKYVAISQTDITNLIPNINSEKQAVVYRSTTILKDISGKWEKKMPGWNSPYPPLFSEDSKFA